MANLQVRYVPEDVHEALRRRAARANMSLSDYVLTQLRDITSRPSIEEWIEQLQKHPRTVLGPDVDIAAIMREDRDSRWS